MPRPPPRCRSGSPRHRSSVARAAAVQCSSFNSDPAESAAGASGSALAAAAWLQQTGASAAAGRAAVALARARPAADTGALLADALSGRCFAPHSPHCPSDESPGAYLRRTGISSAVGAAVVSAVRHRPIEPAEHLAQSVTAPPEPAEPWLQLRPLCHSQRHSMALQLCRRMGMQCDVCHRRIRQGELMYYCSPCRFSCCMRANEKDRPCRAALQIAEPWSTAVARAAEAAERTRLERLWALELVGTAEESLRSSIRYEELCAGAQLWAHRRRTRPAAFEVLAEEIARSTRFGAGLDCKPCQITEPWDFTEAAWDFTEAAGSLRLAEPDWPDGGRPPPSWGSGDEGAFPGLHQLRKVLEVLRGHPEVPRQPWQQQRGEGGAETSGGCRMLLWLYNLPALWEEAGLPELWRQYRSTELGADFESQGGCHFHACDLVCSDPRHLIRGGGSTCCAVHNGAAVLHRILAADGDFQPTLWQPYANWLARGREGEPPKPKQHPLPSKFKGLSAGRAAEGTFASFLYTYNLQVPNGTDAPRAVELRGDDAEEMGWELNGLAIKTVKADGRADRAGLKAKQVIVAAGGVDATVQLESEGDVVDALARGATTLFVIPMRCTQRPLQAYQVLNYAMRERPSAENEKAHNLDLVLSVFHPWTVRLEKFVRSMCSQTEKLFRGMSRVRVGRHYRIGTHVVYHAFTSMSQDDAVAWKFAGSDGGTWVVIAAVKAMDASWVSQFTAEKEMLLPPNTRLRVMDKPAESVLAVLSTTNDTFCMVQDDDTEEPSRADTTPFPRSRTWDDPQTTFEMRVKAMASQRVVFRELESVYVEPRVQWEKSLNDVQQRALHAVENVFTPETDCSLRQRSRGDRPRRQTEILTTPEVSAVFGLPPEVATEKVRCVRPPEVLQHLSLSGTDQSADSARSSGSEVESVHSPIEQVASWDEYGSGERLFEAFEQWRQTDIQWLLLLAPQGGGKSSALLSLYARQLQDEAPTLPLFVSLSLVKEIGSENWLRRQALQQLGLKDADWQQPQGRQMLYFCDSADDSGVSATHLVGTSLAERAGIPPEHRGIMSVRTDDLERMHLSPESLVGPQGAVLEILQFQADDREQFCQKLAEGAAAKAAQILAKEQGEEAQCAARRTVLLQRLPGKLPPDEKLGQLHKAVLQGHADKVKIQEEAFAKSSADLTLSFLSRSSEDKELASALLFTMAAEAAQQLEDSADSAAVIEAWLRRRMRRLATRVAPEAWQAAAVSCDEEERVNVLMQVAEAAAAALTLLRKWRCQVGEACARAAPLCELPAVAIYHKAFQHLLSGVPLRAPDTDGQSSMALPHSRVHEHLAARWAEHAAARGMIAEALTVVRALKSWAGALGVAEQAALGVAEAAKGAVRMGQAEAGDARMAQVEAARLTLDKGTQHARFVELLQQKHQWPDILAAELQYQYGSAQRKAEQAGEAIAPLRRAYELRRELWGPGHPETLKAVSSLGTALCYVSGEAVEGQRNEGEHFLAVARDGFDKLAAARDDSDRARVLDAVIWCDMELAQSHKDRHQYKEAEEVYKRAVEHLERTRGPEHPLTLRTVGNLAFALTGGKRWGDALPLWHRCYVGSVKVFPQGHESTQMAAENYAIALLRTELPKDAKRAQKILKYHGLFKERDQLRKEHRSKLRKRYAALGEIQYAQKLHEKLLYFEESWPELLADVRRQLENIRAGKEPFHGAEKKRREKLEHRLISQRHFYVYKGREEYRLLLEGDAAGNYPELVQEAKEQLARMERGEEPFEDAEKVRDYILRRQSAEVRGDDFGEPHPEVACPLNQSLLLEECDFSPLSPRRSVKRHSFICPMHGSTMSGLHPQRSDLFSSGLESPTNYSTMSPSPKGRHWGSPRHAHG
eukprot:TRINITY_DN6521_c0_g1_i4.p1 TRINITY_DN6521_c0_g1~~TRINITY_DN6521_c0_g1_i4.p1  ORF type:complete len:1894 (+),score=510.66 TRINITY_DN6521_c0_g1_i4:71-5683(+)